MDRELWESQHTAIVWRGAGASTGQLLVALLGGQLGVTPAADASQRQALYITVPESGTQMSPIQYSFTQAVPQ